MNNLKKAIEQKNIREVDLAKYLKISPQRLNNWTRGKNYPGIKYMKLISEYLNKSIKKLFFEED